MSGPLNPGLGPDQWGNAPDASSPVTELRAWLTTMDAAADRWKVEAHEDRWLPLFADVHSAIASAEALLPSGAVFAGGAGVAAYAFACSTYQRTKDQLVLSSDAYLTEDEQLSAWDRLLAGVRVFGVWIVVVLVLLVAIKVAGLARRTA